MSDFDQYAGGGFSSVGGYNDPAGSQAEEQQRMLDDQLNQQRLEQEANDAAQFAQQEVASSQPSNEPAIQVTSNNRRAGRKSRRKNDQSNPNTQRPTKPVEINRFFALLGFVVAGIWGMGLVPGDGQLFGSLVAAMFGAYIAGRYHQILIAGVVVGGGWWFLSHLPERGTSPDSSMVDRVAMEFSGSESFQSNSQSGGMSIDDTSGRSTPAVRPAGAKISSRSEIEQGSTRPTLNKPSILLRPHQPLVTDVTRMRRFQEQLLDFEKRTGKSFLTEHRSMKPLSVERYDYFSRYDGEGLVDGRLEIEDIRPIQGVWEYQSPQLWEIDLEATVNQSFVFTTTYPNGNRREGVMRTYPGDGLCYRALSNPLIRDGRSHATFRIPVAGGKIWRDFVKAIYHAKTDRELLALDPMNRAITETHRKVAQAKARHQINLQQANGMRQGLGIWSKTKESIQQRQKQLQR